MKYTATLKAVKEHPELMVEILKAALEITNHSPDDDFGDISDEVWALAEVTGELPCSVFEEMEVGRKETHPNGERSE